MEQNCEMLTSVLCCVVLISAALCEDTAKMRYFYRSIDDYAEMPMVDAHDIFKSSWYNSSRTTVIFTHGFTGYPQGPAVTAVINSYLDRGDSNVVLLNWKKMAASVYPSMVTSYLNWAAPNAKKLGQTLATTLLNMSAAGFNLNKTQLVGHSLGAHIFGIAGNVLLRKGILLPWIIGLDPASAGFEGRPPATRLNADSASFVAVIHSDPSKYGARRAMGTVDFWPNFKAAGNVVQPSCGARGPMFSPEDLCNHNRCWQLLVDSMKYPGTLLGSYAKNYRRWKEASKEDRQAVVLEIGVNDKNAIPGDYFFITSGQSPYGLGKDGL